MLVDQTLTSVGGCQLQLASGDQVLWMYNAFAGYPFLTLFSGSESSGSSVASAIVEVGKPLTVSVGEYKSSEGTHHVVKPFTTGAEVSPVLTGEHDFQKVDTASGESVTTEASGNAQITFNTPGWHRLKATANEAFRSNRLDVCVVPEGASKCTASPPADDLVRSASEHAHEPPVEEPPSTPKVETPVPGGMSPAPPHAPASSLGVGGFTATLPTQERVDGLLLTPLDDRAAALVYRGHWRKLDEAGAWRGTVSIGTSGASLTAHLARGRPVCSCATSATARASRCGSARTARSSRSRRARARRQEPCCRPGARAPARSR